jgi:hypothetical protein
MGRFREDASEGRSIFIIKHYNLSGKPVKCTVNNGLIKNYSCIINEIAGWKVVGAVYYYVIVGKDL